MGLFGKPNIDKMKAKGDVPRLTMALAHKDSDIREAAAQALGKIGDPQAVEPLLGTLADGNAHVRERAAEALGTLGDPRAVEALIAALKDEGRYVRAAAAGALGDIGDPRAVEPLVSALTAGDGPVRERAAAALGMIGDPRAVEPLMAALKDDDRYVCARAAGALGKIGDPRALEALNAASVTGGERRTDDGAMGSSETPASPGTRTPSTGQKTLTGVLLVSAFVPVSYVAVLAGKWMAEGTEGGRAVPIVMVGLTAVALVLLGVAAIAVAKRWPRVFRASAGVGTAVLAPVSLWMLASDQEVREGAFFVVVTAGALLLVGLVLLVFVKVNDFLSD